MPRTTQASAPTAALLVDSRANAVLTGLGILHASALSGAAIDNLGTLTVSNAKIVDNQALDTPLMGGDAIGGGIFNAGSATLTGVTIANNTATGSKGSNGDGGGIYNMGQMAVTDCTISGNKASSAGGAIYNVGTLQLAATTVSGNNGSSAGGGIDNAAPHTLTLTDTIVAGNNGFPGVPSPSPDIAGSVDPTSTWNLIGNGTGMTGISQGDRTIIKWARKAKPLTPNWPPCTIAAAPP